MAAGETIALAYELGREYNDDFQRATTPQLADKLRQLATDSHKYRAKKDRKQQRSSFRDILHYVEVSAQVFMLTKSVGLCNVEMLINLNLLKERAFKI
jgi:phage I-like protein